MKKPIFKIAITSVLVSLLFTIVFMCMYPMFYRSAQSNEDSEYENEWHLRQLIKSNYILYKALYQKETGELVSYADLYMDEENSSLSNEIEPESLHDELLIFTNDTFSYIEGNQFAEVESRYDYYIEDTKTGGFITNSSSLAEQQIEYGFYVEMVYDKYGNIVVENVYSKNTDTVFKTLSNLTRAKSLVVESEYERDVIFNTPTNCRIVYGLSKNQIKNYTEGYSYSAAYNSGIVGVYGIMIGIIALFAWLFPMKKFLGGSVQNYKIFRLPMEAVLFEISMILSLCESAISFISLMSGYTATRIGNALHIYYAPTATVLACLVHGLGVFVLFFAAWHVGLCLQSLREEGIIGYIKKYSFIYRIFPYTKKKAMEVYDAIEHYDVTKKAHNTILKIVLMNAVILFIISTLWFGGFMVTIIYSVVLYFVLRTFISRLQKKYSIMLSKVNQISEGNLNVGIPEDLGVFEPFKLQLLRIQSGFKNAVDAEVKGQRMKAELITNVSHDLKTPLTAIITYVNLLKDENLTDEQRQEYVATLDKKSMRLKVLIEDLFEVSKATSGNVTFTPTDMDICNLIKQVALELSDKLDSSALDVKMNLPDEKIIVNLDSQKTYRIFENLINNIAKYSMVGTRVYISCVKRGAHVAIEMKNISATELMVNPDDLTERFVRGDASRNTEGSGLGLAIAKNFVELQGGHMSIQTDGDLFKVVTVFPIKVNPQMDQYNYS